MKRAVCILVFLALLIGCSSAAAAAPTPEKVSGIWVFFKEVIKGKRVDPAEWEGYNLEYWFHEDGTGKFILTSRVDRTVTPFTWFVKGNTVMAVDKSIYNPDDPYTDGIQEIFKMSGSYLVAIGDVVDTSYAADGIYYKKTSDTTGKTVTKVITSKGTFKLNNKKMTAAFVAPPNKTDTSVTIPSSVYANEDDYTVTEISANACSGMAKLSSLSIGSNVTTIGASAFRGCASLKAVSIPAKVTSVGANAFCGCKKLAKVSGMAAVKTIDTAAFSGCVSLKAVNIPGKVTAIGKKAFYGCTALAKATGMTAVKTIGDGAFQNCKALTAFTIEAKVTKIGANAWSGCSALKSMTVKARLKAANVGANAFRIASAGTMKCPSGMKAEFDKWVYKKGLPKGVITK